MGNQPKKPKGKPASATTNARAAVPAPAPGAVSVPAVLPAPEVEVPAATVPKAAGSTVDAQQVAPSADKAEVADFLVNTQGPTLRATVPQRPAYWLR